MDEETPASAQSAASHRVPAQVHAVLRLTGPRELLVDDPMFRPGADLGPRSALFRLQLFAAPGLRSVAVAIQNLEDGPSLINSAERYAAAVWERHCPTEPEPPVWVQRQLWSDRPGWGEKEKWQLVTFAETAPFELRGPQWHTVTDDQLEQLVGRPVDAGRGAGYVPRPPVPEPEPHFEIWPVSRLGRPAPFREPECMPAGAPRWRRRLRQALPTRRTRACCWYHGGDWHAATRLALAIFDLARRNDISAEELATYADRHAEAAGASGWQREALESLFSPALAIQPDDEGHYVNGQHRAQALMDAGVRRTVVLVHRWPETSPQRS